MECGSWCVYYASRGTSGACTNCSAYTAEAKSKFESGGLNVFELAQKLAKKRELERRGQIPQLSSCPKCHKLALFYDAIGDNFECLVLECKYTVASGTAEHEAIMLKIYDDGE